MLHRPARVKTLEALTQEGPGKGPSRCGSASVPEAGRKAAPGGHRPRDTPRRYRGGTPQNSAGGVGLFPLTRLPRAEIREAAPVTGKLPRA